MNVFISWSGDKSRRIALQLRDWLPNIIQSLEPWMSKEDIDAGAKWNTEISAKLADTNFGIICLTKTNQIKPWIMFEAGALAKVVQGAYVVPYLIDLKHAEVEQGPLSQFQGKTATKDDTFHMLMTLNKAAGSPLTEERLRHTFEKFWPDLSQAIQTLPEDTAPSRPRRSMEDTLDEVLVMVRSIERRQTNTGRLVPSQAKASDLRISSRPMPANLLEYLWHDAELDEGMKHTRRRHRPALLRSFVRTRLPNYEGQTEHMIWDMIHRPVLEYFNEKYVDVEDLTPRANSGDHVTHEAEEQP